MCGTNHPWVYIIAYALCKARKIAQAQLVEMRATYVQAALSRWWEIEEEQSLAEVALVGSAGRRASRMWGRNSTMKAKLF